MRKALQPLAFDLLDSLAAHIVVLDRQGRIVAVNEAWRRFARDNGGAADAYEHGASYLEVCERAARSGDRSAAEMLQGLRSVLRGDSAQFRLEYPCHSPGTRRWFAAEVTRFAHDGADYVVAVHEDITARQVAQEALVETEALLRKVLDALPVGVWILDREGRIVHGNPASHAIWGGALYVGPERFGEYRGWWADTGLPLASGDWAAVRAIRDGETSLDEEIRIQCFDGSTKTILNSALPLRDAKGEVSGAIIVNQDITARNTVKEELLAANLAVDAMNRELQEVLGREQLKARTDDLTGLFNRRHFFELAAPLFAGAERYGTPLALMMLDIDHFKRVNDAFGHQAGDRVLQRVARIANAQTRAADVLARYGGEEFIVAMPNTDAREGLAAAENLRRTIGECREMAGPLELRVTVSVGIAERVPGDTLESLIRRADQALYEAKEAGRNRCVALSATVPAPTGVTPSG